ncbi:NanQ anomerase/TabA/YiaL family protein [Paenibacillus pini]|uniref:Sugar isomerase n=1 Tax=Paenibacillus pini JCM 16418 TaxID=1236976 RepID=W7YJN0_9BACL|nr:YhcH/YjgK/YiaL family protein [Paenibacillus pini]GAF08717.1 sugar isomerase [Paenibacillus pini JCM 16418]
MILGSLSSWENDKKYEHPVIVEAIDKLLTIVKGNPETGRIEIDGDQMYVSVMELEAKSPAEQLAEKHESYIDIHYLIEGEETIGWFSEENGLEPVKAYDHEGDYAIYNPDASEILLNLKPGMFAVFFPHDIHRPSMGQPLATIKKAVVKVHVDLLLQ